MSTTVQACGDDVRLLLGDIDDTAPVYPIAGVERAVRGMTRMFPSIGLTVDPSRRNLVRTDGADVTANQYALLTFRTAKQFVVANPDAYEFRTRALTEKMSGWANLIWDLEMAIHDLENGSMFDGWQQLNSFFQGNRGLKLGYVTTQMKGPYPNYNLTYPVLGGSASSIENPSGG